jgi:hypothetical protein
MDESDSKNYKKIKGKRKKDNLLQRYISYVSDVLSPTWVRRPIQTNNGSEWFILGCRCNLLLNFRMFLVILYLAYEVFK